MKSKKAKMEMKSKKTKEEVMDFSVLDILDTGSPLRRIFTCQRADKSS